MSIHDVYIYCAESDVAPFVNIIEQQIKTILKTFGI